MEERNKCNVEAQFEKIYSLILKIEEKLDDQNQHLKCLFDRISAIEIRLRPEYQEIINK